MTERNTPSRNDRAQNGGRGRDAERQTVPNARDELERERELYSAHDPRQSGASPAQRYAEKQAADRAAGYSSPGATGSFARADWRAGAAGGSTAASGAGAWGGGVGGAGAGASTPSSATGSGTQSGGSDAASGRSSDTGSSAWARWQAEVAARTERESGAESGASLSGRLPRVDSGTSRGATGADWQQDSSVRSAIDRMQGGRAADAWSTGAFPADVQAGQSPSQRIPRISQTGSLAAVRRAQQDEPSRERSMRLTPEDRLSRPDDGTGSFRSASATGSWRTADTANATGSWLTTGSAGDTGAWAKRADDGETETQTEQSADRSERAGRTASQSDRARESQRPSARNASSFSNADRYRTIGAKRPSSGQSFFKACIAVAVVAVIGVGGFFGYSAWAATQPVDVTINGEAKTISGNERSLEGLLDEGVVSVTPGNYVAVDGSVMREGEGTRCTAVLNGDEQSDLGTHLNEGDVIDISNGTDIMEQYTDSDPQTLPHSANLNGVGAVHVYLDGAQDGEKVTRTGSESGITTEITTKEPVDRTVQYYNVDTGGDKVIALTFDDGPWDSSTEAILDILKDNDAKATFFTVGQKISGHEDLVKRMADEGHEIGTHTWDHAEGSGQGVSLILMSSDERKDEVEKGLAAIKDATGQDASTIFRAPGGNFDASVASDLDGIVTAEIGWNVDTEDWKRPGADTIAQRIESARPGSIVLMHDGGGDRSQTVAALRKALPKLKEEGYTFVTVQELIERYPYQGDN